MTSTVSPSCVPSEFNEFLYSPIGEDKNGLLVTVLSAFARQNIDPWQEAADLDGLPRDTAVQKLTSIIAALPSHQPMLGDPTPTAVRLIALLPRRAASDKPAQQPGGYAVARPLAIAAEGAVDCRLHSSLAAQSLVVQVRRDIPKARVSARDRMRLSRFDSMSKRSA